MAYGVVSTMNLCYATTRLRDVVPPTQIHQPTTYIKDVVKSFTPPAAMPSHGTMGVRRAQLPPNERTAAPGVRVKHTHPMINSMRKENAMFILPRANQWKSICEKRTPYLFSTSAIQCTTEMALATMNMIRHCPHHQKA